jgi:hypothetical protein
MVDEIDLSELLRAVEQVREIYRTPLLLRPSGARPAQRNVGECCDARRPLRSGE